MSGPESEEPAAGLVLEYRLDAPPERVWRAISIPAFRDQWLPDADLSGAEPVSTRPGEEIRYGLRGAGAAPGPSIVTFRIGPDGRGGTILTIVHAPPETGRRGIQPANGNDPPLMRAA